MTADASPRREPPDDRRLWQLHEVADAAREVPYEHQPARLRQALASLFLALSRTLPERPAPPG